MNYKRLFARLMSAALFMTAAALPAEAKQEEKTIEAVTGEAAFAQAGESINDVQAVTDAATFELPIEVKFCQTEARSELAMINELRTGEDAWYWNEDDTEKIVLDNLEEIRYDYALEKVAMQRAVEAAIYYSHTRPNGGRFFTAYNDLGYSWRNCGENIAAGYRTASAVFTGWEEENEAYAGQGHRRNMLNADFKAVGCACVYYEGYYYWVQNFSSAVVDGQETAANDSTSIETAVVSNSNADIWTVNPSSIDIVDHKPYDISELVCVNYKLAVSGWSPQQRERKSMLKPDWTTDDTTIAKVDNGVLTGYKGGTTKIIAASPDGGSTLAAPVNVDCRFVNSASISLDGLIGINFYIYIPEAEVADTDVVLTFHGKDTVLPASEAATTVKNDKTVRIFRTSAAAKEMRDIITVKVQDKNGNRKYLEYHGNDVSTGHHYSIADYFEAARANSTDTDLLKLIDAMDSYGKYAQIQFNYNLDSFTGTDPLEDIDMTVLANYAPKTDKELDGLSYKSGSLQLESDTGIRVNYTLGTGHNISEYTFKTDGNKTSATLKSGNKYYVAIRDIAAKKMKQSYAFTAQDQSGNVMTTEYSPLSYVYSVLSNASAPESLKNVCKAIYWYGETAEQYFSSHTQE